MIRKFDQSIQVCDVIFHKDLDKALETAALEYALQLPEIWSKIVEAVPSGTSTESLLDCESLVHQLSGSAGCYGYSQLSSVSSEIEKLLRSLRDDGLHDCGMVWLALSNAITHGEKLVSEIALQAELKYSNFT